MRLHASDGGMQRLFADNVFMFFTYSTRYMEPPILTAGTSSSGRAFVLVEDAYERGALKQGVGAEKPVSTRSREEEGFDAVSVGVFEQTLKTDKEQNAKICWSKEIAA